MPTSNGNDNRLSSIPMMLHALAVLSDPLASVRQVAETYRLNPITLVMYAPNTL
ncbi:hypothetical protein [Xylella fastidiosa]|uniref:hypothetical protein n=1 Tax=Xylella fastidiosa TaxID=2371 RepID=UPI0012D9105E|nr:hypothetical protein [Xylella fastidiosa]MDG5825286.1 hypothetical protein [Xylella fastidiosa subsp. pauca]QPB73216.1 hypothetical protein XFC3_13070 [Xylella fastidiosa]